jgi:hypothetical protein
MFIFIYVQHMEILVEQICVTFIDETIIKK